MSANAKIEVMEVNGRSWCRLKSRNGRVVMHSENYEAPGTARRTAHKVAGVFGLDVVDNTVATLAKLAKAKAKMKTQVATARKVARTVKTPRVNLPKATALV